MSDRFSAVGVEVGVVTARGSELLTFYRDTLGLELEVSVALGDGGAMHRLKCGASIIKIVCPVGTPIAGITSTAPANPVESIPEVMDLCALVRGFRLVTILVDSLDVALDRCAQDKAPIVCAPMDETRESQTGELQPLRWAVVEDPDGNWIEFVEFVNP